MKSRISATQAALVAVVCAATGCHPTALQQGSRRGRAARAHEGLAYLALVVCGYTGSAVADLLGVRPSAVYRAAQRGRTARGRWERVLTVGETEKNIRMSPLNGLILSLGSLPRKRNLQRGMEHRLDSIPKGRLPNMATS